MENLLNWEKVVEGGFGDKYNICLWSMTEFKEYLYGGTMNLKNGCQVYRSKTGNKDTWEKVSLNGFGQNNKCIGARNMIVFNDLLWVVTYSRDHGTQVWITNGEHARGGILKWKKATLLFLTILIILSIFGPMRIAYDTYQFQINEEENAINYLASTISIETVNKVAISGINYGYLTKKFVYTNFDKNHTNKLWALAPRNPELLNIFNGSMDENEYIISNPNLYKEIVSYGSDIKEVEKIKEQMLYNNKIYICGKTCIFLGLSNI